jgi:eukaryotic-like serine/threonine-protein kinase
VSAESTTIGAGTRLGSYRLDALLGQGGMGAVYRATHIKLERSVAIKVLNQDLASDVQFVSRFFHEAKIVNAVRHPNIVDVYDFLELEDPKCVAYVMELIEGPSLSALLKKGPLTPFQAINATIQIASALEAVHRVSVVHRDLKPDNVLVTAPNTDLSAVPSVKILDFGIAKIADPSKAHQTGTGYLLGTPQYMAPEQIGGEPVSPATDVYALAEILFEMITGRRLFHGEMHSVFRAKFTGDKSGLVVPKEIPESSSLAAIIEACIQVAPASRPPLVEMTTALRRIRDEGAIRNAPTLVRSGTKEAEPADTSPRLLQPSLVQPPTLARRTPRAIYVGLTLGVAFAIVLAIVLAIGRQQEPAPVVAPLAPAEAPAEPAPTPVAPPPPSAEPVKAEPKRETEKKKQPRPVKKPAPIKKEELPTW